jgi:hypothetical protein
MNYIVKSAGNGASQKHMIIDFTAKHNVLTIEGEVFVTDAVDGSYQYDVCDWEITHLDGHDGCSHNSIWSAFTTLYGSDYIATLATSIESALIEVAGTVLAPKTPQNAPQHTATDFESMPMEERVDRIDWEAVKYVFEHQFDFTSNLQSALDDVSLDDAAEVEVNNSYGSRDFSVELSFDNREIAKEMVNAMADGIYEFCDYQAKENATATAA